MAVIVRPAWAQNEPTVVDPALAGMSANRLENLSRYVAQKIERGVLSGAVIAIARNGQTVYLNAAGHRDEQATEVMVADALFDISTLTQPIVAAGALVLQERGQWLLSDRLGQYIKGFERHKTSLLGLLRQSAGLPETVLTPPGSPIPGSRIRHSLLAALNFTGTGFGDAVAVSRSWQPADQRSRNGFSYDVLGLAIEQVTEQTLGGYLLREIFIPLDMWNTGFNAGPEMTARFVKPLARASAEAVGVTGSTPARDLNRPVSFDCGGACLYSSAGDYLRFAQMLLNNGQLQDKRILSRTSVQYMTTDRLGGVIDSRHSSPGLLRGVSASTRHGYGLGVTVHKNNSPNSLGASPAEFGLAAPTGPYFWVDPTERLAVVVLALIPDAAAQTHFHRSVRALVRQAITD